MKNILITPEGIKTNLKNVKPLEAICEYIWNGFDAGASQIKVYLHTNELGLINMVSVIDNGVGIVYHELPYKFQPFNESKKAGKSSRSNHSLPHGRKGIGRLTFFSFAQMARWETVYEKDGKYQIYAKEIILEGAGLLYQRFEQLKVELEEMGLFDPMYKKPIPRYATRIGICTAQTGAAIQDIINITTRRNPYVQLYLYPCLVQGADAAKDIVNGIRCLDSMNLDTIIVGRGGGSIEDLWAFNEKIVAEAIFNCNTPIISAVGHETDTTIADYVSDRRAPTPSAAAELAVFDYMEFENKLQNYRKMLTTYEKHFIEKNKLLTKNLENSIQMYSPKNMLLTRKQYISDLQMHLTDCFHTILDSRKHMLQIYAVRLNGLSPLNKISKGFAYVENDSGESIKTVEQLKKGDNINLTISDGKIKASVLEVQGENNGE